VLRAFVKEAIFGALNLGYESHEAPAFVPLDKIAESNQFSFLSF
jgi:hypothetical protein